MHFFFSKFWGPKKGVHKLRRDLASPYEILCHKPNVCSMYIKKEEINWSTNAVYLCKFERISAYFNQSDSVMRGLAEITDCEF